MSRLLVTGVSGMLGSTLARVYDGGLEIVGTYRRHPPRDEGSRAVQVDLVDEKAVVDALDDHEPIAVVHLAAMTNTGACERDEKACQAVNVEATRTLARACASRDIAFVFASTDLVFAGDDAPYAETDDPNPINAYGRSKAEAERHVLEYRRACVCRLPLLFGRPAPIFHDSRGKHGGSFLQGFLATLRDGEPMTLFTDEVRTMVSAKDAALGLLVAVNHLLEGWPVPAEQRILHLGGPQRLSRFDFGVMLCRAYGLDPALIRAGTQADVALPAPRPADVSLSSQRASSMGFAPRPAAEALSSIAGGGD